MKLQHLAVIFIAIMLPMSLIISAYTQIQIDTLTLQQQYDVNLKKATYDAVKAFDMNTTQSNVSNVADSLRGDIQAAISTFVKSFSTSLGVSGYNEEVIKPYIPAILFSLYDGYYIYAPTLVNGEYEYILQPYNYYSVRYYKDSSNDIVVNYALDNYIVVYGYVDGKYVAKSGYLTNGTKTVKSEEVLEEYVPVAKLDGTTISEVKISDEPIVVTDSNKYAPSAPTSNGGQYLYERNDLYYIDPKSAEKYYENAVIFTDWVTENLKWVTPSMAKRNSEFINGPFENDNTQIFNIGNDNDPEKEDSAFNSHRVEVIQNSIENNLNYVITAYANSEGEDYTYRLPKLNPDEWLMISSNICMVPFVQGLPVGTRFYNNYAVVKSSTNKLFAEPENIYFVDGGEYYHRIDCQHLGDGGGTITGYSSYAFQPFYIHVTEMGTEGDWYYWRHLEKACYYCIVSSDYESEFIERDEDGNLIRNIDNLSCKNPTIKEKKITAYYTAVARERYRQYKVTDYLGDANRLEDAG